MRQWWIVVVSLVATIFHIPSKTIPESHLPTPTPFTYRASPGLTIVTTGDVMLGRSVNFQSTKLKDFTWPWAKVADLLRQSDIAFINLEAPLVPNCPITQEGMIFCADPRHIQGLKHAGIDVANLANNHTSNFGQNGLNSTVQLLTDNNIKPAGISGPVYLTTKDQTVAFLGYNIVGASVSASLVATDIRKARQNANLVVVAFHWGSEYTTQVSPQQKYLAHLAIDSGADLIVGNHPHWIQPTEYYKDKLIIYSHGNFIFDQMWSAKTREGIVGKFTFSNYKLTNAQFLPVQIESFGQPSF